MVVDCNGVLVWCCGNDGSGWMMDVIFNRGMLMVVELVVVVEMGCWWEWW